MGYYGYMWGLVIAQDMFVTRFAAEGILNQRTGIDFRNKIYKPGGSQDGDFMVKNFLGRPFNPNVLWQKEGIFGK